VPTALDVVDGEVRELIRRRGLDPFTDPAPVRVLVRDVVADYSERSLNSALPPIGDPESVVRDVLDRVAGFGPLQRYLDDPEIEEIWINYRLAYGSVAWPRAEGPGRGGVPAEETVAADRLAALCIYLQARHSGRQDAVLPGIDAGPLPCETGLTYIGGPAPEVSAELGCTDGHRGR
jgi:pilus assembly protein CpaF